MNDIIHINSQLAEQSHSTDDLIEQYLADLQDVMDSSKKRYRKSLKKYFAWLVTKGYTVRGVTLTEILQYKQSLIDAKLADGSRLSDVTIGTYLVALKGFYKWANSKGFPFNAAAMLKSPKKDGKFKREYIPEDKLNELFAYFEKISIRNLSIAKILYYCGLRTIELVRLNWGDIRWATEGRRVIDVQGKGKKKKDRTVNLTDKSFWVLESYKKYKLEKYGDSAITADAPIFASEGAGGGRGRLITGTVSEIIKAGLRAIGMDSRKFSAHSLRHSAGTIAMQKGGTKEEVRDMLRHSSTTITDIYTKAIDAENRLKKSAEDLL